MTMWILKVILLFSFQAQAQQIPAVDSASSPSAEIAVIAPAEDTAAPAVETAKKSLKESEIPVKLDSNKKSASGESPFFRFIMSFGIIGVLGGAAFFLIRKYQFKNPQSQATQIKVLSQHYLGPKKSLAIVRVAGESVLIGVTDHNISMIKSLSLLDEDIPEETPQEFRSVFAKSTNKAGDPVQFSTPELSGEETDSKDEFSISGIKDFVSLKLKNMRSLE